MQRHYVRGTTVAISSFTWLGCELFGIHEGYGRYPDRDQDRNDGIEVRTRLSGLKQILHCVQNDISISDLCRHPEHS